MTEANARGTFYFKGYQRLLLEDEKHIPSAFYTDTVSLQPSLSQPAKCFCVITHWLYTSPSLCV